MPETPPAQVLFDQALSRAAGATLVHGNLRLGRRAGGGAGRFWRILREGGVEVRCFNPPRFDEPVGGVRRNHRKSLVIDGTVAFVSGLCVGKMWEGWPERGLPGWRDTGVELRGHECLRAGVAGGGG